MNSKQRFVLLCEGYLEFLARRRAVIEGQIKALEDKS